MRRNSPLYNERVPTKGNRFPPTWVEHTSRQRQSQQHETCNTIEILPNHIAIVSWFRGDIPFRSGEVGLATLRHTVPARDLDVPRAQCVQRFGVILAVLGAVGRQLGTIGLHLFGRRHPKSVLSRPSLRLKSRARSREMGIDIAAYSLLAPTSSPFCTLNAPAAGHRRTPTRPVEPV